MLPCFVMNRSHRFNHVHDQSVVETRQRRAATPAAFLEKELAASGRAQTCNTVQLLSAAQAKSSRFIQGKGISSLDMFCMWIPHHFILCGTILGNSPIVLRWLSQAHSMHACTCCVS